jgi:hypothetical protein
MYPDCYAGRCRFTLEPHTRTPCLRDRSLQTIFPRHQCSQTPSMISVADLFACIDVDEYGHRSLASLRRRNAKRLTKSTCAQSRSQISGNEQSALAMTSSRLLRKPPSPSAAPRTDGIFWNAPQRRGRASVGDLFHSSASKNDFCSRRVH